MLPRCQPSRQERVLFSGGRSPPTNRFASRQILPLLPVIALTTYPDDQPAPRARPVRDGDGGSAAIVCAWSRGGALCKA